MFKVNNKDTKTTPEWRRSGVFIVIFEHISDLSVSTVNFKQVNAGWENKQVPYLHCGPLEKVNINPFVPDAPFLYHLKTLHQLRQK